MYISLSAIGRTFGDINAKIGALNADFHMIDVDDLFRHVETEAEKITRLRTRVRAFARVLGVEEDYVFFDEISYEGNDFTPGGDALDHVDNVAKVYDWISGTLGEWDYLPLIARLYADGWKYINFDDLRGEAEDFFM